MPSSQTTYYIIYIYKEGKNRLWFLGEFRKYDWGPEENLRRYNAVIPPEYNLKNTTVPVALFYGETDLIVAKEVNLFNCYNLLIHIGMLVPK